MAFSVIVLYLFVCFYYFVIIIQKQQCSGVCLYPLTLCFFVCFVCCILVVYCIVLCLVCVLYCSIWLLWDIHLFSFVLY